MSLTKAAFLDKTKPRCELIKDVVGFGDVWIRSCPHVQASRRLVSMFNGDGEIDRSEQSKKSVYMLIDQVMASETEPMFTEEDFDLLAGCDDGKLEPLLAALEAFNAPDQKKVTGE